MPIQNNSTPPMKVIIHARDAHPATGSPNINFLIIIKKTIKNARAVKKRPNQEAIASGVCEKLIMPSIEYLKSFQKLHFVAPAARSIFSYGSQ